MGSKSNILTKFWLNWLGMGSKPIPSQFNPNLVRMLLLLPIPSQFNQNLVRMLLLLPIPSHFTCCSFGEMWHC
jgi:hypothetical protein